MALLFDQVAKEREFDDDEVVLLGILFGGRPAGGAVARLHLGDPLAEVVGVLPVVGFVGDDRRPRPDEQARVLPFECVPNLGGVGRSAFLDERVEGVEAAVEWFVHLAVRGPNVAGEQSLDELLVGDVVERLDEEVHEFESRLVEGPFVHQRPPSSKRSAARHCPQ